MCTATWRHDDGGYELCFNRDIGDSRAAADPPAIQVLGGVLAITPREHVSGGSWIGVNAHGVALAILNYWYPEGGTPQEGRESRGTLLWSLLDARSQNDALGRVSTRDLRAVNPFQLLVLERGGVPAVATWRPELGSVRVTRPAPCPLISSSFATAEVIERRTALFRTSVADDPSSARLRAYHGGHLPERGPYSVCMHRADAATVSFSRIRVSASVISFEYQAGSPCAPGPLNATSIPPSSPAAEPLALAQGAPSCTHAARN